MNETTVLSLVFALTGLLFVGLSVPPILKILPPNPYYGFRTAKTLSDPGIWYQANYSAGCGLLVAGAVTAAFSLLISVIGREWNSGYVLGALLAVMLLSLFGSVRYGERVAAHL